MAHILKNDQVALHIDLPNENYRLSRFDWTGKIVKLIYRGVTMTSHELPDSKAPNQGLGLYNEFGIDRPVGFDEIEVGDWFHKIGIGLLQKQSEVYNFNRLHNIRPAQFQVHAETDRITINCRSEAYNGYAYELKKIICLDNEGFQISYELTNSGEKVIQTNEYTHNFLAFNGASMGQDYHLHWPFKIKPNSFLETVNPDRLVNVGDRVIKFSGEPQQPFFFSNLSGGEAVEAQWTLENTQQKMSLSETGSFTTEAINLWGWGHVVSPELFFQVNVAPGKSIFWSRDYLVNSR